MSGPLPPTSSALSDDGHRPYFLWWTEANTRDVWGFVNPTQIRASGHLLQLPASPWPPQQARKAPECWPGSWRSFHWSLCR